METNSSSFFWYDYVTCFLLLALSTFIGIYFGCFGSKQASIQEYLMGGKIMKKLPMGLSIAVSHLSGTTLTVVPADVFRYGAGIGLLSLSYLLGGLLTGFLYLPVFFKMQHTSVYEYLEKRFDRKTKFLCSSLYVMSEMLRFPVHAYTPCLTFATASGISLELTTCIVCGICIFYTAIGGFKTVVWTDLLQCFIIFGSLITIYVIGVQTSGHFLTEWTTALNGKRLEIFNNLNPDPTIRDSFWTFAIGGTSAVTAGLAVHQTAVQKFLALPTFRSCIHSLIYAITVLISITIFCVFIGVSIYARYSNCDPLAFKKIIKHDQLTTYYMADLARNIPGVSGLFVASVLSAALSSLSSDLNALTGVIYKDFITLFLTADLSEKYGGIILKLTTVLIGFAALLLVFLVQHLGEILSITHSVLGMTNGPLLGIFTLGVLFPKADAQGAFYGTLGATFIMASFVLSSKYYQWHYSVNYPTKPFFLDKCDIWNKSSNHFDKSNVNLNETLQNQVPYIFRISFLYYTFIGMTLTLILGLIISCITNKNSPPVDENLLSPVSQYFLRKNLKNNDRVRYNSVQKALDNLEIGNNKTIETR